MCSSKRVERPCAKASAIDARHSRRVGPLLRSSYTYARRLQFKLSPESKPGLSTGVKKRLCTLCVLPNRSNTRSGANQSSRDQRCRKTHRSCRAGLQHTEQQP